MMIKRMQEKSEIRGKAFVHYQSWKEAYKGLVDQAFLNRRTYEMSVQSAFGAFEKGISTWITMEQDRVIGFIDFGAYRGTYLAYTGEIYAVYILSEYYDLGVGSELMKKALSEMADYDRIALWVLKDNERAIRFYLKHGFKPDGIERLITLGTEIMEIRMERQR